MPARQRSRSSARQRDIRGNSRDRARRRAWVLEAFDPDLGPDRARCRLQLSGGCLGVVDRLTLWVDRIIPGGTYCRENIQPGCGPCQIEQGGLLGVAARRLAQ